MFISTPLHAGIYLYIRLARNVLQTLKNESILQLKYIRTVCGQYISRTPEHHDELYIDSRCLQTYSICQILALSHNDCDNQVPTISLSLFPPRRAHAAHCHAKLKHWYISTTVPSHILCAKPAWKSLLKPAGCTQCLHMIEL